MKAWPILLLLAVATVSGVQGWRMGAAFVRTEAALALAAARAQAVRAAENAHRAEAARLAAAAERDQLALALEDAAHADIDADTVVLGFDSVRRLDQR